MTTPETYTQAVIGLFDEIAANDAKRFGMDLAETNASEIWKAEVKSAIAWLTRSKTEFTSDDVWQVLYERKVTEPENPAAMGSMFRWAAKEGLITFSGRYVQSKKKSTHARDIKVWVSK